MVKRVAVDIDPPKATSTLAERIVWLRELRKMSPAELCRATRTPSQKAISQPSLWAIENGHTKKIKADTLFRLAAALSANPSWIKDGVGDPFKMATPTSQEDDEAMRKYLALTPERKAMILAAIRAVSSD